MVFVFNRRLDRGYININSAMAEAGSYDLIEAAINVYPEFIQIKNLTCLTLRAIAWTNAQNNASTIIVGNFTTNGITFSNASKCQVEGFTIGNMLSGVEFRDDAIDNRLANCNLIYNWNDGVYLSNGSARNNIIESNYCMGNWNGIQIRRGNDNRVIANYCKANDSDGIFLRGSVNNTLVKNNISVSNFLRGLYLRPSNNICDGVMIISNYFARNLGNHGGIRIQSGSVIGEEVINTVVSNNIICSNLASGLMIVDDNTDRTIIVGNRIFANLNDGIELREADDSVIRGNMIYMNKDGISFKDSCTNYSVSENIIFRNNHGIHLNTDTQDISVSNNRIFQNARNGMQVQSNAINNRIIENSIFSNGSRGINIGDETSTVNNLITKNNLINNINADFRNGGTTPMVVTNNWWGTTILSNIRNRIQGNSPAASNFAPYRLFGPFDITPGADTDRLPSVSWVTAAVSGTNVTLTWTMPADISDFIRYFIYKSQSAGIDNLTRADVVGQINDPSITNFSDSIGIDRTFYYYITALDDADTGTTLFTNESWYSPAAAAVGPVAVSNLSNFIAYPLYLPSTTNGVFTWDDAAGETGYLISTNTNAPFLVNLPANTTSWTDVTVVDGQSNTYYLRATNSFLKFEWAIAVLKMTPGIPPTVQNISISNISPDSITVTWDLLPGAAGYILYTNNQRAFYVIDTFSVVSNLPSDREYFFTVKATNAVSLSSNFSQPAHGWTALPPVGPITGGCMDSAYNITWPALPGADGYLITYGTNPDPLSGWFKTSSPVNSVSGIVPAGFGITNYIAVMGTNSHTTNQTFLNRNNLTLIKLVPISPVTNLLVTVNSVSNTLVQWQKSISAKGYIISTNSPGPGSMITILDSSTTNWTNRLDNSLRAITYYVTATNEYGYSAWAAFTTNYFLPGNLPDPFKGGRIIIAPTTLINNERLYFKGVTRESLLAIYDIKGRKIWKARADDPSQCIPDGEFLYIDPDVTGNLAPGHICHPV